MPSAPLDHGFTHAIYFPAPNEHYSAVVKTLTPSGVADLIYFRRNDTTGAPEAAEVEAVPHMRWPFLPLAFPGAGPANAFAVIGADPSTWRVGNILAGAPPGMVRLGVQDASGSADEAIDLGSPEVIVHGNPAAYFPFWLFNPTFSAPPDVPPIVAAACAPVP